MSFERARSKEQKQQRIEEIMTAVDSLHTRRDYHNITLADIAKEAGFTRSNLYKYFSTKEDIFLIFIGRHITDWAEETASVLQTHTTLSPKQFAAIWTDMLLKHKKLLRLMPLLFTIMEKYASEEVLVEFKKEILSNQLELADIINGFFPKLEAENFLNVAIALINGIYPMVQAHEQHHALLTKHNIDHFLMNLMDTYKDTLVRLILSAENS